LTALDRKAQAFASGAARCLSQVLDIGTHAAGRVTATLSQQEKNNTADLQRNRVNISGFTCTVAR
jgi:RES domain-containing protein